jgi:hypothetical protein
MMFDSFWWLMMMITVNSLSIKNGGVMMGMRYGVYNGGYTGITLLGGVVRVIKWV